MGRVGQVAGEPPGRVRVSGLRHHRDLQPGGDAGQLGWVEHRLPDIPDHIVPSWEEVQSGEWSPWDEVRDGPRRLIDTTDTASALPLVLDAVNRTRD